MRDIWNEGAKAAEAEQREFTADEFYRQLDGLRYEEVVNYTDPTGDTAKTRYRNAPKRENRPRVLNARQSEQPNDLPSMPPANTAYGWPGYQRGGPQANHGY